jgi:hypothetical protein
MSPGSGSPVMRTVPHCDVNVDVGDSRELADLGADGAGAVIAAHPGDGKGASRHDRYRNGGTGTPRARGDPLSFVSAMELARATMTVIRANLAWASGYNLVAIPLAALGYLNPLFAGDRDVGQLADRRRQQPAAAPLPRPPAARRGHGMLILTGTVTIDVPVTAPGTP